MEMTPEHKALADKHGALEGEHDKLKAKHSAFKGAVCKAMGLGHEAAEDEILKAIEGKIKELEKLQGAETARAKMEAEGDAEMVAARHGVTDAEGKKDLLALRMSNPDAFKRLYKTALSAAIVAPPARTESNALSMRVAPQGLTVQGGDAEIDAVAKFNAEVNEMTSKLMKEQPDMYRTGASAMRAAVELVTAAHR